LTPGRNPREAFGSKCSRNVINEIDEFLIRGL
jgi:hypothetical protein